MANVNTRHLFDDFKDQRSRFDSITEEVKKASTMKNIQDVVEGRRADIFEILSTTRADWNNNKDINSLKGMHDELDWKKGELERELWEVTNDLDLSWKNGNIDLVNYCAKIFSKKTNKSQKTTELAGRCNNLLWNLQKVYDDKNISKTENLFDGVKPSIEEDRKDLVGWDGFKTTIESLDEAALRNNIDKFVNNVFNKYNNSFHISTNKLYPGWKSAEKQEKIAIRIAIFLQFMEKACEEWKLNSKDITDVTKILDALQDVQIPKIRWIYNLKKEKEAVDAMYYTLEDLIRNRNTKLEPFSEDKVTVTLTDLFEWKSTGLAQKIDFYNVTKDKIKITIWGKKYSWDNIILQNWLRSIDQLNWTVWNYKLLLKTPWWDVEIWTICIDSSETGGWVCMVFEKNNDFAKKLADQWIHWKMEIDIPVLAVKNVWTPRSHTWQVSLKKNIKFGYDVIEVVKKYSGKHIKKNVWDTMEAKELVNWLDGTEKAVEFEPAGAKPDLSTPTKWVTREIDVKITKADGSTETVKWKYDVIEVVKKYSGKHIVRYVWETIEAKELVEWLDTTETAVEFDPAGATPDIDTATEPWVAREIGVKVTKADGTSEIVIWTYEVIDAFETAVISDASESYRDMISREVENEINEEWHNTWKFNVIKRLDFFLRRWNIRKKKIQKLEEKYERTPFTTNRLLNLEMAKQAARHDLEAVLWSDISREKTFGKIERKGIALDAAQKTEFKDMCQKYVSWVDSIWVFQGKFNKFVQESLHLPEKQEFLATNVLEKLDAIKNDNKLLGDIMVELEAYKTDAAHDHFENIKEMINHYYDENKKDPRFRDKIVEIIGKEKTGDPELIDEIDKFLNHEKALTKLATTNLEIKLDLLKNGKWAYQTNNKDRENWLFKVWHAFDKMPRWWQTLTAVWIMASGAAVAAGTAALFPAFTVLWLNWAAFAGTAFMSGTVWLKNFVKKWTHHTKEQNTYEKNLTRDYENEIKKMKKWEKIMEEQDDEWNYTHSWFARYKAKRQLELYWKTTQAELQNKHDWNTKEIIDILYTGLGKRDNNTLTDLKDINNFNKTLLDAMARLQIYRELWHNFLKSKEGNQIEREFYDLENVLILSAKHIFWPSATLKDIPAGIEAYERVEEDEHGNVKKYWEINYDNLLKKYRDDYESASKTFRKERGWLAAKRWAATAGITFGTALATQAITHTWMYARDAVAEIPEVPDTMSTTNTWNVSGGFWLGKYELSGWNEIFQAAKDNISGLSSKDVVTLHFWAWTDATPVSAGSALLNHETYLTKLEQVKEVIRSSALENQQELIRQLDNWFATSWFTNTDLHGMRCLEAIEETVKWAWNFAGKLNLSYDTAMDIDWTIVYDAASRMSNSYLEISKFVEWTPWTEAIAAWNKKLIIGLPRFSNTFKEKPDEKKAA